MVMLDNEEFTLTLSLTRRPLCLKPPKVCVLFSLGQEDDFLSYKEVRSLILQRCRLPGEI